MVIFFVLFCFFIFQLFCFSFWPTRCCVHWSFRSRRQSVAWSFHNSSARFVCVSSRLERIIGILHQHKLLRPQLISESWTVGTDIIWCQTVAERTVHELLETKNHFKVTWLVTLPPPLPPPPSSSMWAILRKEVCLHNPDSCCCCCRTQRRKQKRHCYLIWSSDAAWEPGVKNDYSATAAVSLRYSYLFIQFFFYYCSRDWSSSSSSRQYTHTCLVFRPR